MGDVYVKLSEAQSLLNQYRWLVESMGLDSSKLELALQTDWRGGFPYEKFALSALQLTRDFSRTRFSERGIEESNKFLDSLLMGNSAPPSKAESINQN